MNILCIFAVDLITEEMLMSTKTEKKENMKINDKLIESTAPKQMPSIWYT